MMDSSDFTTWLGNSARGILSVAFLGHQPYLLRRPCPCHRPRTSCVAHKPGGNVMQTMAPPCAGSARAAHSLLASKHSSAIPAVCAAMKARTGRVIPCNGHFPASRCKVFFISGRRKAFRGPTRARAAPREAYRSTRPSARARSPRFVPPWVSSAISRTRPQETYPCIHLNVAESRGSTGGPRAAGRGRAPARE